MGWASRANLNRGIPPRTAPVRDVPANTAVWLARWYAMTDRVFGIPVTFTKKKDATVLVDRERVIVNGQNEPPLRPGYIRAYMPVEEGHVATE